MSLPPIKLGALIAGGKSRRMGRDKALLDWHGKPLWQHQLDTLVALNPERLVVVAPEVPAWLPSSIEWVKDHDNLGPINQVRPIGPIGGVLAALELVGEGLVAALAVDLPSVSPNYFAQLQNACEGARGAIPHTPEGFEPLAALYPANAAALARDWIADGHHDFQGWITRLVEQGMIRAMEVGPSEEAIFRNLNTPEDLT